MAQRLATLFAGAVAVLAVGGSGPDAGAAIDPAQVRQALSGLRLVNYYPARAAQTRMWQAWDADVLNHDFGLIAGLNANAVRLAVFPEAFGYPEATAEAATKLARAVELARAHGLRVKLTLFGFFDRFGDLDGSRRWADALLAPYRGGTDVACVDLFNELDLARPGAREWARAMVPFVRAELNGHAPVTVSVSNTAGLRGLKALREAGVPVDYFELHYYGKPELALTALEEAAAVIAPAPLFIGETGYSTEPGAHKGEVAYDRTWWEAYQSEYHRGVQWAARALALPAAAPWVFSDFEPGAFPPGSKVALDPGEFAFGLYRADGTPKPAAVAVARAFGGDMDLSFNNGFEDGNALPALWRLWQPHAASFARDPSVAHSGQASARIRGSSASHSGEPAFYLSPVEGVWPGRVYTASVWARGERSTGMNRLRLAWFDIHGKYLGRADSMALPTGTNGWTRLTVTARAPAGAASVQIHLASRDNRGTVWFDDISFNGLGG